jgi:NAD(P)-dependent dehydrogenase (short-subunit alcohol dehydrogenase family)
MIVLKDKNALVTGSSRGIGQQIVEGLAKLGCNVIVHGRTKDGILILILLNSDSILCKYGFG